MTMITVRLEFDSDVLKSVEEFFEGYIGFVPKNAPQAHIEGSTNERIVAFGWAEHIIDLIAPRNRWNIGIIIGGLPFGMTYKDIIIHEVLHPLHFEAGLGDIHERGKGWRDNREMFELWKLHYDPYKHFIFKNNAMRFILEGWEIITQFGSSTPFQSKHLGTDYRARYQPIYMPESGEITRKFYGINGGVWLEWR